MQKYLTFGLILSLVSGACFAEHPRIAQLIVEKQQKMKKLEDCQGTTKALKIAGLSTLGITAVGVAGNIAEAVVLSDTKDKLKSAKSDLEKEQKKKDDHDAADAKKAEDKKKAECEEDLNAQYDNGECKCNQNFEKGNDGKCVSKQQPKGQNASSPSVESANGQSNDMPAVKTDKEELSHNLPLKIVEKPASVKGSKHTTDANKQKQACKTLGGTPKGNDCKYEKELIVVDDLKISVEQLLTKAQLTLDSFKPDSQEYIVIAKTTDETAFLSIRIPINNVKCNVNGNYLNKYGKCTNGKNAEKKSDENPAKANNNEPLPFTELCTRIEATFKNETTTCEKEMDKKNIKSWTDFITKNNFKCEDINDSEGNVVVVKCTQKQYLIQILVKDDTPAAETE